MTTATAPPAEKHPAEQAPIDPRAQQKADARALRDLIRPVAPQLAIGRILAVISGVLAVVPYIALVHLGDVLLDAARTDTAVDSGEVNRWIRILVVTFTLRLATSWPWA